MVKIWLLSSLIAATSVGLAFAGYTEIYQAVGERNHAEILGDVYGGTFTGEGVELSNSMWTRYSNSTVTAYRIDDFDERGALSLKVNLFKGKVGEVVDQIWTDGISTITAKARHAAFEQSLGWNGGGLAGDTYKELLTTIGQSVEFNVGDDFLWGIQPDCLEWWSLITENTGEPEPYDHMATYKIEGLETNQTVWMLFFEDLPSTQTDRDYNDFVVEVRAIPEPATITIFGVGVSIALTVGKRFV